MGSSEDRQARALEGILGQLTFVNQLLRKLVEIKDLPERPADTGQLTLQDIIKDRQSVADVRIPVFFGSGQNMDEVVGFADVTDNTATFIIEGEQLTRRLASLVSLDEVRGFFLGIRYTLPNTKAEVE